MALIAALEMTAKSVEAEATQINDAFVKADDDDWGERHQTTDHKTVEKIEFIEFYPNDRQHGRRYSQIELYDPETWNKIEPGKTYRIEVHSLD